jgi:hypothetical protein
MKTEINEFWKYFLSIQIDLINADQNGNAALGNKLFENLHKKGKKIDRLLDFLIVYRIDGGSTAKLIFIPKGKYRLRAIAAQMLALAPKVSLWVFDIGIKPYRESIISLCAKHNFLKHDTTVYQIYFAVHKIYKTSNKLHLLMYLQVDRSISKSELHEAMENILLWFLGDTLYYKHISRFKIIRRKYSAINFIPMDEFINLVQYKSIN